MKADRIFKNAKIFTSNPDAPLASALAVKDGEFVYVGGEDGLADYQGEVTDLGGRFLMPAIIDSHVHVTIGVGFEYTDMGERIECEGKPAILAFMKEYVRDNPGLVRYVFTLERKKLNGASLTKEDLDAVCRDVDVVVLEGECHSAWVNSRIMARHGVTDDTPDIVPGLHYYVRDENGHVTGNAFEVAAWLFLFDPLEGLPDTHIEAAVARWIDFSVHAGVACVFDAGYPELPTLHERIYKHLRDLDRQGKLPVYVDGCYVLMRPQKTREALEELKRFHREYNTEHLKVHTLKIFMDGTLKIETAALVTPYADTQATGATSFNSEQIAEILKELNALGMDLHVHTVGERASRVILDGVELARKALGDSYRVKVTCAHLEIQDDADLDRFAKLGVFANFTPWWHSGNMGGDPVVFWNETLGPQRAERMYRCKTLWDTGALVTWSSDEVFYGDFEEWNPYLGMEVGMTRWINDKTRVAEYNRTVAPFPSPAERMSIEEMLLGYTVNGARQLGIEAAKGSIEVGKDADFLVFDNDLLTAEHEGFSHNLPRDVYFRGEKMN